MQDEDFKWFTENLPRLYGQYGDCFLAIKGKKVLGAYETRHEGIAKTGEIEEPGTFIVQQCGPDPSVYTKRIASTNFMGCETW